MVEAAVGGNGETQIAVNFLVNILQGGRRRHAGLDGKTQTVSLIWPVVWVLPENDNLYSIEGSGIEGVKNLRARRVNSVTRLLFCLQKGAQIAHVILLEFGAQLLQPGRLELYFFRHVLRFLNQADHISRRRTSLMTLTK